MPQAKLKTVKSLVLHSKKVSKLFLVKFSAHENHFILDSFLVEPVGIHFSSKPDISRNFQGGEFMEFLMRPGRWDGEKSLTICVRRSCFQIVCKIVQSSAKTSSFSHNM